jgi:hypothetical protein
MRQRYHERVRQLASGAEVLINDADAAASVEARAQIAASINRFTKRYFELPTQARPAHQNLIEQTRMSNASSIAASMARRGSWSNFSVHHLLGVGVRGDAAARTGRLFVAIDEVLADLEGQYGHLADVSQSIASLREDVKEWEHDFLGQALALGRAAFKLHLDEANELWRQCAARWGRGPGYRSEVADMLQKWFETHSELDAARRSVDSGLNQAWREIVLNSLVAVTQVDHEDNDAAAA